MTADLLNVFWIFAVGAIATVFVTWVLARCAPAMGLMDMPTARKTHGEPTPLVGGLALFVVLMVVSIALQAFSWLMLCAGILVLMGALDDARHLGVRLRLVFQLVCACMMLIGSGVSIQSLGVYHGLSLTLGWFAPIFTLFAVIGITNAFNMLDGLDGLASGHALVALLSLITAGLLGNPLIEGMWLAGLAGAIFGFWCVNMRLTPVRRVFLGDAGSTLIGFLLAWLIIGYTQAPWDRLQPLAALWCLSFPVFDTCAVVGRRIRAGRSPFAPDRLHLHHRLIDLGVSPRHAVFLMLGAALTLNVAGLLVLAAWGATVSLSFYLALFGLFLYGSLHPELDQAVVSRILRVSKQV